jgi:hypothetical protein
MRLEDFIPNQTFPDLQHVRVHPSSTSTIGLDAELSQILRRSPTLTQLDLHSTNASGFFQSSRRAPRKQDLFTVATRLTLHGCEFLYGLFRADVISCPSLRAMSVKDWRNNRVFIDKLKSDELPFLRALSIKRYSQHTDSSCRTPTTFSWRPDIASKRSNHCTPAESDYPFSIRSPRRK